MSYTPIPIDREALTIMTATPDRGVVDLWEFSFFCGLASFFSKTAKNVP